MIHKGKAKIEDGKVMCASQLCNECDCLKRFNCVDVEIREVNTIGKEIMEAKENIKKNRK